MKEKTTEKSVIKLNQYDGPSMGECGKRCDGCGVRNCSSAIGHFGPHRCGIC